MNNAAPENTAALQEKIAELEQQRRRGGHTAVERECAAREGGGGPDEFAHRERDAADEHGGKDAQPEGELERRHRHQPAGVEMHDVVCPRHARGEREEYAVGAHIAAGGVEAQNAGKAQRAADELAAVRPFVAEGDAGDDHQHGIDEVQRGGKARGEVVIGREEQRTDEPVADAADQNILELLPAQAQLFAHAAASAAYKKNEKDHDAGGKTGEGLRERIAAADVDGFGKERVQTVEDRGQNGQKNSPCLHGFCLRFSCCYWGIIRRGKGKSNGLLTS